MLAIETAGPVAAPVYFAPDETSGSPLPVEAPAATTENPVPELPKAETTPKQDNADTNSSNAAQRLLRKAEARVVELEAAEKARKQADMSELDRLKAENDELKPVRDEHGRYKAALQEQFDRELAGVAEDKRQQVLDLIGNGSLDAQLRSLQAARSLLGTSPAPPPVIKAGSVTQPGTNQAPSAAERVASAMKSGNSLEAIRLMRSEQFQDK